MILSDMLPQSNEYDGSNGSPIKSLNLNTIDGQSSNDNSITRTINLFNSIDG